jgi:hypothetical protein
MHMDAELRNQLKQSAEAIAKAMAKWQKVKDIAEDILAWCERDTRRFKIRVEVAAGVRIIRGCISGIHCYFWFGESVADAPLKEIYRQFFESVEAVANMIKSLAEAVAELAEKQIEELEEQA